MQIVCIGEALIDMICTDKGTRLSDGEHFLKKPGGAPTNVAAAIGAFGGQVALVAKVGKDPFGDQLIATMQGLGVSTQWMMQDPNYFTTLTFVSLMHNGERDFVFNRGADGQLTAAETDQISLTDTSIVHFGSATAFLPGPLQSAYNSLLARAQQAKRIISFDPNYRHLLFKDDHPGFIRQSWNYMTEAHFFKLSDEEAFILTGVDTVEAAAKQLQEKTKGIFAITLGKEGTLLRHHDQLISVPSVPIEAVDTTGAGDAFVGAVLYQLRHHTIDSFAQLSTKDWERIIANGNKAGARTCAFFGAMEAFTSLNQELFQ